MIKRQFKCVICGEVFTKEFPDERSANRSRKKYCSTCSRKRKNKPRVRRKGDKKYTDINCAELDNELNRSLKRRGIKSEKMGPMKIIKIDHGFEDTMKAKSIGESAASLYMERMRRQANANKGE